LANICSKYFVATEEPIDVGGNPANVTLGFGGPSNTRHTGYVLAGVCLPVTVSVALVSGGSTECHLVAYVSYLL